MLTPNQLKKTHSVLKNVYVRKLKSEYDKTIFYNDEPISFMNHIKGRIDDCITTFMNKHLEEIELLHTLFRRCEIAAALELKYKKPIEILLINLYCYYKNREDRMRRERERYVEAKRQVVA